jgi:hypothetical protein
MPIEPGTAETARSSIVAAAVPPPPPLPSAGHAGDSASSSSASALHASTPDHPVAGAASANAAAAASNAAPCVSWLPSVFTSIANHIFFPAAEAFHVEHASPHHQHTPQHSHPNSHTLAHTQQTTPPHLAHHHAHHSGAADAAPSSARVHNAIHDVVILNASPLVVSDAAGALGATAPTPVSQLQFKNERTALERAKVTTRAPVRLTFRHFSIDALGEVLATLRPTVLSLNGHGYLRRDGMANGRATFADAIRLMRAAFRVLFIVFKAHTLG